jgi:hypothetical protein
MQKRATEGTEDTEKIKKMKTLFFFKIAFLRDLCDLCGYGQHRDARNQPGHVFQAAVTGIKLVHVAYIDIPPHQRLSTNAIHRNSMVLLAQSAVCVLTHIRRQNSGA